MTEVGGAGLPEPQAPRPLSLPAMPQHRLGNGLTVITVPRTTLPLVSVTLLLRVGAAIDPPGRPGVAAMTVTLLSKGARRRGRGGRPGLDMGASALAREAEGLGGALNSFSGWRSVGVGMTVTSPRLPAALALLADMLRTPLLAADELERARAQALDGWRVTVSSPSDLAGLLMRRAFWGDSAYGAVAPAAALKRLRLDDVRQFHARHARPEVAALVLAGDISPEHAALLAQQLLGDWPAQGALLPEVPATPPKPIAAPLVLLDMPGSGQASVLLAAPFVASDAPDRVVGLVANAVLGGGYSARLNHAVRIQRGLSYGAFSDVEVFPAGGMLVARAQTQHAGAGELLHLMRTELSQMAVTPPSAAELGARQAALVGSFARQLETTGGLAQLVANQWTQGRPLAALAQHVGQLLAVSPDDVQRFAQTHWAPERWRAVVAADLTAAGDSLSMAARPQALRLDLAQLDLEQPGLLAKPPGS